MLILGEDPLSQFLRDAKARAHAWGQFDCLLFLAEWVWVKRGFDAAAEFRRRYRTDEQALEIVLKNGGVAGLISRCVRPFGIKQTDAPQRGDIAVVKFPIIGGIGGIVLSPPDGPQGTAACLMERRGLYFTKLIGGVSIAMAWEV